MRAGLVVGHEQAAGGHTRKRQGARRGAAHWAKIIEAQGQTALTVVAFCRRHRIAKATFWYWRRRLLTTHQQFGVAKPAQRFLAVPVLTPVVERIEVELGTMCVRLEGADATRVVDAIVARVGSAA